MTAEVKTNRITYREAMRQALATPCNVIRVCSLWERMSAVMVAVLR